MRKCDFCLRFVFKLYYLKEETWEVLLTDTGLIDNPPKMPVTTGKSVPT